MYNATINVIYYKSKMVILCPRNHIFISIEFKCFWCLPRAIKNYMTYLRLFVISQGLLVYQVIIFDVDLIGFSLSNIGAKSSVFSNRIALKMCCTILFIFRRINNLFLKSSWYVLLLITSLLESIKSSTILTNCISKYSLFPVHVGCTWS